jgi:hypothetical protein
MNTTIPSLQTTFATPAMPTQKPKVAKEVSSPSLPLSRGALIRMVRQYARTHF